MLRRKKRIGFLALIPLLAFSLFCLSTSFHFHEPSSGPSTSTECKVCQALSQTPHEGAIKSQKILSPHFFSEIMMGVFNTPLSLFNLSTNSRAPPLSC